MNGSNALMIAANSFEQRAATRERLALVEPYLPRKAALVRQAAHDLTRACRLRGMPNVVALPPIDYAPTATAADRAPLWFWS